MVDDDKFNNEISLKLEEIEDDINKLNRSIYYLEGEYLGNTSLSGNIVKGWEQMFSSKPKLSNNNQSHNFLNKKIKVLTSERIFSQTDIKSFNKIDSENINKLKEKSNEKGVVKIESRIKLHKKKPLRRNFSDN